MYAVGKIKLEKKCSKKLVLLEETFTFWNYEIVALLSEICKNTRDHNTEIKNCI